jgi:hypothetical protein
MPLRLHNLSVRSAFHSGPLVVELVQKGCDILERNYRMRFSCSNTTFAGFLEVLTQRIASHSVTVTE